MKAKITKDTEKLFDPFYIAVLGGKQTPISLNEFLGNPQKYAETGIGYLYSNQSELIKAIKSGSSEESVQLNMESKGVTRGKYFDENFKSEKERVLADMDSERDRQRKRLSQKFVKKQKAIKAEAERIKSEQLKEVEKDANKPVADVITE